MNLLLENGEADYCYYINMTLMKLALNKISN